jgi:arginase
MGNLPVPQRESVRRPGGETELEAITVVCRELAARTAAVIREGEFPVVLGGDHSLSAGSVAGAATAMAERGKRLGVIWLDAHGDINTPESSLSGNVHGMPVAHLLGLGDRAMASIASPAPALRAEDIVYVGLRDVDLAEREQIKALGIRAYTASQHTGGLYLSCDADWIDPSEAPGVGTPVPGGATYREAHLAMELLADTGLLVGMDLVEINPVLDRANGTAELAVELIASALGKRTL